MLVKYSWKIDILQAPKPNSCICTRSPQPQGDVVARPRPAGQPLRGGYRGQRHQRAQADPTQEGRPPHHPHLPGVQQQHLRPRLHFRQARHAL